MSNFNCERCGAPCLDSEHGYVTGCEHYPPDVKPMSVDIKSGTDDQGDTVELIFINTGD